MITHQQADERVKMGFFIHFGVYVIVMGILMGLNFTRTPDKLWSIWVACGWGAGVLLHSALVFLNPRSRERMIERTMNRMERRQQAHEQHAGHRRM